jgi:hypothetical protein
VTWADLAFTALIALLIVLNIVAAVAIILHRLAYKEHWRRRR